MLLRGFVSILFLAVLVTTVLVSCTGDETTSQSGEEGRTVLAEGDAGRREVTEQTMEATGELAPKNRGCRGREEREDSIRVGDFVPPESSSVPSYEILEDEPVEREDVKAVRLLVDTRARDEADYTPIARDIKAQYEDYDAVTVEFTDTTDTLSYNGSALIFNTPLGACYMGYVYGPPNNEGYFVSAASR